MQKLIPMAVLLLALFTAQQALAAAAEPLVFASAEQEARYIRLTTELRCLVCQNQNLADSDAPLAQDLRKEIWEMMQTGQNDEQIKTFLVERYGDFVLYRPPVQGNTLALWVTPGVLLFGGAVILFFVVRNRKRRLLAQQIQGAD